VVRRWLIFLATAAALAGAVWAVCAGSVRQRAESLCAAANDAGRRYDFVAAHNGWRAYLELRPDDADAHLRAARCARRAEFLEDYTGPHAELSEAVADALGAAERLGAVAADVALERSLAWVQHGEASGNDDLREAAGSGDPRRVLILEALIHRHLRQLQFEKALACVESLLELNSDHALGLLWRGRIREQFKQVRAGREDYEEALKVVPDFDAARYYLAESLLRSRQAGEAEAHLRVLIDRGTDNLLARLAWAKCRIALGDADTGRDLLDAWLADAPAKHPRLLEAYVARARLALALGQPAEAESFARRALRESPLDQYALYDLARSLNAQGRGPEARAVEEQLDRIKRDLRVVARCREELAKHPDDLSLRHEIGAAYLRVGRPGEALVWLNSVLARDPKHRPTLQTLADYHAQQSAVSHQRSADR
jgi:tetratricopeptide (TPR) repeat protein